MATHWSILAWRILRTEEPGRLQSMGLQRLRHDWRDLPHMHITYASGFPASTAFAVLSLSLLLALNKLTPFSNTASGNSFPTRAQTTTTDCSSVVPFLVSVKPKNTIKWKPGRKKNLLLAPSPSKKNTGTLGIFPKAVCPWTAILWMF